ncbi:hypothetical protein K7X08_000031 [Anisodus acutangulus]|uniref:Uncharacterized protein n=1 Tax=Anisodus acutangulus TaxID=402998 RepID=A0A9Q1MIJ8_9SOLA|nr:hypothetical protein K7X08_000031 [Anisodus acutangulus]
MEGVGNQSNDTTNFGPSELVGGDFEDNPTTHQIVNNNDLANDRVNESDNDSPLDHEGMDDDQLSADDDESDEDVAPPGDLSFNYHSNVIPYLDNTEEEGPEDFACMRDNIHIRVALWDFEFPKVIKLC